MQYNGTGALVELLRSLSSYSEEKRQDLFLEVVIAGGRSM